MSSLATNRPDAEQTADATPPTAVATTGSTHTWSTANASFVAGSVATLMYLLIVVLATTGHPVRKQLLSAVRSLSSKRLAGH